MRTTIWEWGGRVRFRGSEESRQDGARTETSVGCRLSRVITAENNSWGQEAALKEGIFKEVIVTGSEKTAPDSFKKTPTNEDRENQRGQNRKSEMRTSRKVG